MHSVNSIPLLSESVFNMFKSIKKANVTTGSFYTKTHLCGHHYKLYNTFYIIGLKLELDISIVHYE